LDFVDANNQPMDSTIWLRNGGGKSSILNLFFAMLRTGRRDFLGGKADSKRRQIEDYVLNNDRSIVAAEWELDVPDDTLHFAREPGRFITGVFYERAPGREGLRRLFFSSRVAEDEPESTLAGLPIDVIDEEGKSHRRTLASFRQAWTALRDRVPHLQPSATEVQSEWRERLNDAGLDPDLFRYQLRMNMREGGADELFRFSSTEAFIDFLLELTVDPTRGETVSENLVTFRKQLQRRKHELLPDHQLSTGLIERLTPLAELAERRAQSQREMLQTAQRAQDLKHAIAYTAQQLAGEAESAAAGIDATRREANHFHQESAAMRGRAVAVKRDALQTKRRQVEQSAIAAKENEVAARRDATVWRAAVPHREAELADNEARAYRKNFENRQVEQAPLLEDLKQTATTYVAALRHQAAVQRERQAALKEEVHTREVEARTLETQAAEQERNAAALGVTLQNIENNLKVIDEQRLRLCQSTALPEGMAPELFTAQLREKILRLEGRLRDFADERERLEGVEDEVNRAVQSHQRDLATQLAKLEQLEGESRVAREERAVLEADKVLQRALELEAIDLDALPDDTPALLHRRVLEQQELIARLRTERASLDRARLHLQEYSLMPPTPEVEQMLQVLRGRVSAASGWAYIAENFPPESETRLAIVRAVPEIAQGLVVAARDFEKAINLLQAADYAPEIPVVIATPDALSPDTLAPTQGRRVVLGPQNNAWFDHNAGRNELLHIEERCDALEHRIRAAVTTQAEIADLTHKLRHFRSRYSRGWFAQRQALLTQANAAIDDFRARLEAAEDERQRLHESRRLNEHGTEAARKEIVTLQAATERLEHFIEHFESKAPGWQAEFEEKFQHREQMREEASTLRLQADKVRAQARKAGENIEPLAEEARLLEAQIAQVRYLDAQPKAAPGPVEELRMRFERLRELFEGEMGSDELLRMAEHFESQAQKHRRELNRLVRDGVTLTEVAQAIAQLANPNDIEVNRERAEEHLVLAQNKVYELDYELKLLASQEDDLEKLWFSLGKPSLPDALPQDLDVTAYIAHCEAEAVRLTALAEKTSAAIRETERLAAERQHQAQSLNKDLERLLSILRSHEGFLPPVKEERTRTTEDGGPLSVEAAEVADEIGRIERQLQHAREVADSLDERRKSAVTSLRKWTSDPRFENLRSEIATRFRALDAESLESGAAQFRESLILRVREISATLDDVDRHRMLLTKLVLNAAEEGLRQLKLADRASHVPLEVPEIGGAQFLRISTKEPLTPTARIEMIAQLVDEMVDDDDFPTGVYLVQRAVRQLARPFRVRVLNPDPASPQRYVSITDTARFSGGEQLTCAILLYCTLANVRARARGQNRQPSSVLLLDNPIGRASRVRFLDMQRHFARAMGIQLVYTTAVNDHEALSILPNIIRLRNERIDRNRGHRLLEHDEAGEPGEEIIGLLESTRVAKHEDSLHPPAIDTDAT